MSGSYGPPARDECLIRDAKAWPWEAKSWVAPMCMTRAFESPLRQIAAISANYPNKYVHDRR